MPRTSGEFDFTAAARKWLALANNQLLYFDELYRSGRWKRYYASPDRFAAQMQEAIKTAHIWARLVEKSRTNGRNDLRPAE